MSRLLACIGCIVLLGISWMLVITEKSDAKIQEELVAEAKTLLEDKIYVRAEPLLEEAAAYQEPLRDEAERLLKEVYTALGDVTGYARKMTTLIEKQISRKDSPVEVYLEAAEYYLEKGKETKAIAALRAGVENTGDEGLKSEYERLRYSYGYSGYTYSDATQVYNGMIQVKYLDKWGLADHTGELVIPCEYDKISTYSNSSAIVQKDGEIYTVNSSNLRTYLLHEKVLDFGNFGNNLVALKTEEGWVRSSGTFTVGSKAFEELGMYTEGYAAAKWNDKWGVIDTDAEWVVEPEYDEIIMDELGRCWAQGAVFAKKDGKVYLIVDEKTGTQTYDDAQPFNKAGWAAVKSDGKWMFIDTEGNVQLKCDYTEVRSFSEHLAAVMLDGMWGYISMDGTMVIDAQFLDAGYFSEGAAPVQTNEGWQFIVLDEYLED